jgi:uncharacterized membrane protein (UPF0127 family)
MHNINIALLLITFSTFSMADDRIVLEITTIKGNEELPKILYIVPWKEVEQSKNEEQKLVLHSLFGDLFDPAYPSQ